MNSLKADASFSQDLSLAALSFSTSYGRKFKLEGIYIHTTVPITETITITLDSGKGATYDTVERVKSLSGESNFVWVPEGQKNYQANDVIKIQCTQANGVGIIYGVVKASEVLL